MCDSTRSFLATSAIYGSKFSAVCQVPGSNFLYCSLKTWMYKSLMDSCRKNKPLVTSPWPLKKPPVLSHVPAPAAFVGRSSSFCSPLSQPLLRHTPPCPGCHQKLGSFSMANVSWLKIIEPNWFNQWKIYGKSMGK